MTNGRDTLSKVDTVTVAVIETGVPALVEARLTADRRFDAESTMHHLERADANLDRQARTQLTHADDAGGISLDKIVEPFDAARVQFLDDLARRHARGLRRRLALEAQPCNALCHALASQQPYVVMTMASEAHRHIGVLADPAERILFG